MKKHMNLLATLTLLVSLGVLGSSQARTLNSSASSSNSPQEVAQLRIRVPGADIDEPDEASDESPAEGPAAAAEFTGFSGEFTNYLDDYNGFRLNVPVEFALNQQGQTTDWIGPIINDGAVMIYVNAAPLPGVDPQTLQQTYRQQYEANRDYTDVEPTTVPYGDGTVPALRVREANNRPGSRDEKAANDLHRWHLFVFGNQRVYTWGFTGMYQTFQENHVQALYEEVVSSVELVPIVE
ncbi:MAG: hypothetical protein VKK04_03965 [Synechococcales bacterium]|nr:hypothetical protein [Synechococcales bacterium]